MYSTSLFKINEISSCDFETLIENLLYLLAPTHKNV